MKKIALLFGGPSAERGISLNSARSVYDHLDKEKYEITLLYVNPRLERFKIPHTLIYSNTPLDFDFHLLGNASSLDESQKVSLLKGQDIVFPVIHGTYGEDGQLQEYLENENIEFIGSGSTACRETSDKFVCQQKLQQAGWYVPEHYLIEQGKPLPEITSSAEKWVIKPLNGGSSIGVKILEDTAQLEELGDALFEHQKHYLLEPFCNGQEFTIMVLQNSNGETISLLPSQISFESDTLFDYRKKYLPTNAVRYHTPAQFDQGVISTIRGQAQEVFDLFDLQDGARLDGWVLEDGTIRRSDINAIMGMEQNSFLFHQTSLLGLNHRQTIDYLIEKKISGVDTTGKKKIPVLFGGITAERQVSVLSGTNMMMKLLGSSEYEPFPVFVDSKEDYYHIPYYLCLLHTTEEIEEKIQTLDQSWIDIIYEYRESILTDLAISKDFAAVGLFVPTLISLESLASKYDFMGIGLHGGYAENGVLQAQLEKLGVGYNGPNAKTSYLCNDKQATKDAVEGKIYGVHVAKAVIIDISRKSNELWEEVVTHCGNELILKPNDDGCSAGVIFVHTKEQFVTVVNYYQSGEAVIPAGTLYEGQGLIEMPTQLQKTLLVEEFIKTDDINLEDLQLSISGEYGYVEVTVGVVGTAGAMYVLSPSITVAESKTLSLEEKFMGGTGVNITPLPRQFFSQEVIDSCKQKVKQIIEIVGVTGYSRVDLFLNRHTGEIILIEVNTLPALTPSTVIFHQALAEDDPIYPQQFVEKLIEYTF